MICNNVEAVLRAINENIISNLHLRIGHRTRDSSFDYTTAYQLFEALKRNTSLQELDLYNNQIGAYVGEVAEALKFNTTLKNINLSFN
eukprot:Awhi_evm2s14736